MSEIIRDKVLESAFMVHAICNMLSRGELSIEYKAQRSPDTWTNEYRDGFIASMIKGEDCDSIKICEQPIDGTPNLWIIDGGHRVTALEKYKNNMFALGKSIERSIIKYHVIELDKNGKPLKNEKGNVISRVEEFDLKGKRYSDLPPILKERFDNKNINYVKHLDCTDEDIAYHMRRYNKQKSMNPSETAVTYMPETAGYLKAISKENIFFKDCGSYTSTDRANGSLDRIVIESIMCMYHMDDWKSGSKLNAIFIDKNSSKEEFDTLGNNLERLTPLVSEKYDDLFTVKNTFVLLTLFDRFTKLGLEDSKFEDFLHEFSESLKDVKFEDYENLSFLEYDKTKGTKDKKTIITKIDMLERLMMGFLETDIQAVEPETANEVVEESIVEITETVEENGLTERVNIVSDEDIEEEEESIDILSFIKENVKPDATQVDLDDYIGDFEYRTLYVKGTSKLMREENHPSLLAIIAYSYMEDINIEDWFVDFFDRENDYIENQVENYKYMLADLLAYRQDKDVESVL